MIQKFESLRGVNLTLLYINDVMDNLSMSETP